MDPTLKILTIIGARPQFIKAAPLSKAFAETEGVSEVIVHTGQHFDANMSSIFFDELGIPDPAHHLGIGGGTHGQNTGRMIEALEQAIVAERPDWVLVYGDTDSTLAGAIAAVKLHVPIAHVEAGLRSFNLRMPEEINRKLTDHASTALLTPSLRAVDNLAAEGIADPARVHNVGDVMYDATLMFSAIADARSDALAQHGVERGRYILATIHRQENTDDRVRLSAILDALGAAALPVVLPLHPRTRKRIAEFGLTLPATIVLTDPLGYLDMTRLERDAALIATDSGGIQKEAFFHRVPCVTLRDETEWVELVEMGWNRLARPGHDDLAQVFVTIPSPGRVDDQPYGDGNAAGKIVDVLKGFGG